MSPYKRRRGRKGGEEEKEQTRERWENGAEEEQKEREGGIQKLKKEYRMHERRSGRRGEGGRRRMWKDRRA